MQTPIAYIRSDDEYFSRNDNGTYSLEWLKRHHPKFLRMEYTHALLSSLGFKPVWIACDECGLAYDCFPLDVNLSDHQWALIHPREGGVLCPNCICKLGAKLPGVTFAKLEFR